MFSQRSCSAVQIHCPLFSGWTSCSVMICSVLFSHKCRKVIWLFWSTCLFFSFFFFLEAPQSDLFFVCFVFEAPVSELPDFFGSTLCYQEREVAWFIHPSTHDTGQVTNTGVPFGKLFLLNVQICLFICWASFEIKGLCLILNENLVLSYACAHLCCWVCLKWREYICHWGASFLRMCLWWSLCTLCLLACQVRGTVGDSGFCWCFCVTSFRCQLTPLCVVSLKPHL